MNQNLMDEFCHKRCKAVGLVKCSKVKCTLEALHETMY